MKTGADVLEEYRNQSFATCQLSLEEMIDKELNHYQDIIDACQALYDNFLSRGGNPDSLLGIQVREALKKAKGE